MWIWRRCAEWALALAALVVLVGCSAEDGFGLDFGDRDRGPMDALPPVDMDVDMAADAGPDAGPCPPGQQRGRDGCEPLPADVCPLVDVLRLDCPDRDGDCFVDACTGAPASLIDCDDGRPDIWPGAPEQCDGLDNDCNGQVDEGLGVGDPCEVCGPGVLECAVAGEGVACSTRQGQSAAPPNAALLGEICNEIDDDCDEQVDELCALPGAPGGHEPAICSGSLLVVGLDGRLGNDPGLALEPGPARLPACEGDLQAWLRTDTPCTAPEGQAPRCPRARLIARFRDGPVEELTGIADLGPPVVTGGAVYWHSLLESGPVLQRWVPGGPIEPLFGGDAVSDPSRVVNRRIAVRAWLTAPVRVEVRGLDGERDLRVDGPAAPAGPPALSERWVAWVADSPTPVLWAVPLDRPREGFQIAGTRLPRGRPWLDADRLYWIDTDGLCRFDLLTGATTLLVPGLTDPTAVDIRDGLVVWATDAGVFQHREP